MGTRRRRLTIPRHSNLRRPTRLGLLAALVPLILIVGQVVPAQAAAADVSIVTTASVSSVNASASFTYTLTVTTAGDATGLVVADTIPAAFTLTGGLSSDGTAVCAFVAPTVNCTLANLMNVATWTITVNVTAKTGVPGGVIANTATVASPDDTLTPLNDTSSLDVTLNKSADLSIVKTDSKDPVNAGEAFTYSLVVTNNGPDTANSLVVTDAVPAALTLTAASSSDVAGACTATAPNVNCTLPTLASLATWTITVSVTAKTAIPGGKITNSATVTATEFDPVAANNTSSQETTVNKSADLSIVATDSADPVNAGDAFTYSLVVTNGGPDAATFVVVKDAIPAGLTLTGASSSDATGVCTSVAPDVNCALPTLASLATWTITVNVTADAANPGGALTNTATVLATEFDPSLANNASSQITTVTPSADLSLTNVPSSAKPVEGKDMSFVLTVTNDGPGAATNVVVTAELPQDLKFVSAKSADGDYHSGTGKWNIPSISTPASTGLATNKSAAAAAKGVVTLTITAQPRPGTSGQKIVLKAKITASDQSDPTSNNNADSAAIEVQSASTTGGGTGGGGGGGGTAFTGGDVGGMMGVDLSLLLLGLGAVAASPIRRRYAKGPVRVILGPGDLGETWAC